MRKRVEMKDGQETTIVTFTKTNSVVIKSSDINKGTYAHDFGTFDAARVFFLQTIGALYLDGYR